jgi:hypothetical protein
MKRRRIAAPKVDFEILVADLIEWFKDERHMTVQQLTTDSGSVVLRCDTQKWRNHTGTTVSLEAHLEYTDPYLDVTVTGGRWVGKAGAVAVAGLVGLGTSGAGLILGAPALLGARRQNQVMDETLDQLQHLAAEHANETNRARPEIHVDPGRPKPFDPDEDLVRPHTLEA